ncbi:dihydrodipicolinate synthase family protein [Neisseria sp.]|uniref:dihydrodipicolinate synthase family protein n=1 Tax=Neisseria sp. TaxID=192066 RepID=UPI00289BD49F|nr:dihydrodipicolinate synthase family protein [Neisseria sp.]
MKFEGIYTPAITPLQENGNIDFAAFAEVLEYLIDAKVHGIVIGGSTGEYYAHSLSERIELIKKAKDVISGKLPLVVGTGSIRTEESVELAKAAKAVGADAVLIGTPPYALPDEEENARHALAVDRAADLPVMLYNYPGRMNMTMGEHFFRTVTAHSKNFVAIKESSGSTMQLHLLACRFPDIQLSCGWDDMALEFFAWGATSWVCAGSNFLPQEHIALYEACVLEKDFDKGRRIMQAMMPLMDFLEAAGKFVQSIKYGCRLAGLATGGVRLPLLPLNEQQQEELAQIIKTLKHETSLITGQA